MKDSVLIVNIKPGTLDGLVSQLKRTKFEGGERGITKMVIEAPVIIQLMNRAVSMPSSATTQRFMVVNPMEWLPKRRGMVNAKEVLNKVRLRNRKLRLCEASDALFLRMHLKKQPEGLVLVVGMKPVTNALIRLSNNSSGLRLQSLGCGEHINFKVQEGNTLWIFRCD